MENERLVGKVVFFSDKRGFGFIKPEGWDKDLFCHHEHIKMEGFRTLKAEQNVSFDIGSNDKGEMAINVVVEDE